MVVNKVYTLDARLTRGRFTIYKRKLTFPTLEEANKAKRMLESANKDLGNFECWVTIDESEYYDNIDKLWKLKIWNR